jgi:hypothetical protein
MKDKRLFIYELEAVGVLLQPVASIEKRVKRVIGGPGGI